MKDNTRKTMRTAQGDKDIGNTHEVMALRSPAFDYLHCRSPLL